MSVAHKILYSLLPLNSYLRVVSSLLFAALRVGWGRRNPATEYIYYLPRLIAKGGVAIDIGANLGYYTRPLSKIVGTEGHIYGVEPVAPIFEVLQRNTRGLSNITLYNVALGVEECQITMGNDSVRAGGYFGTGQNFVREGDAKCDVEFTAKMVRGSELFAGLEHLELIKCDIEGYERVVLHEMLPIIERHRPTILLESGGESRAKMVTLFTSMGYKAYTLHCGEEIPYTVDSTKDIIFRA